MQSINSILLNPYKFCLITDDPQLIVLSDPENIQIVRTPEQLTSMPSFRVLAVDYDFLRRHQGFAAIKNKFQRLIFIFKDTAEPVNPALFKETLPHQIIFKSQFNHQVFFDQDHVITEIQQNLTYLNLAADLNQEYENIKHELEHKLNETKHDLLTSRQKILDSNIRIEAMRRILYSITQESDLHRIETILNELLPASSKATWIKIIPENLKASLETELNAQLNTTFKVFKIPQHYIFFIKGDQKSFKKDDLNLFAKISDVIEINYNRELNYNALARTENVVRKAFEEFNQPLAIIDKDYKIIQSNAAFNRYSGLHCHKVLFNSDTICVNCHLGEKFTTPMNDKVFDVSSNPISMDHHTAKLWINMYKDKTEGHYFEQRLSQTVKMKELGIISSSIAHELNNPIGGILSYLQLAQMDLPKNSPHAQDVKLMIDTTLRIKKIIEDLLIFSRTQNLDDTKIYDINQLVQESLSIHEIHFRNENIKIVNTSADAALKLKISKAAFRDALHFIFSFYIEKIKAFRKVNSQKTGLIEVKISPPHPDAADIVNYYIEFLGNAGHLDETEKSKDISLLALSKCLTDQNMHLEIAVPKENWISLKVVMPKS